MIAWRWPQRALSLIFLFLCISTPGVALTSSSQDNPPPPTEDFGTTLRTLINEEIDQWRSDNDIAVNREVAKLIFKGFLKRQAILHTESRSMIIEAEGPVRFLRSLVRQYLYDIRDWKISHDLSLLIKLAGMGLAFTAGSLSGPNAIFEIQPKDVNNLAPERWLDRFLKFLWAHPLLPDVPLGEVSVTSTPKTALITLKEVDFDNKSQKTNKRIIKTDWYTNRDILLTIGKYEVDIHDRKRNLSCEQEISITDGGHERVECNAK
jgi:hypothetical protein